MTATATYIPVDYAAFVAAKAKIDVRMGFDVPASAVHPMLQRHQPDVVRWALAGGRRKGMGVELSPEYFLDGVRYLRSVETELATTAPTLFDFCKEDVA